MLRPTPQPVEWEGLVREIQQSLLFIMLRAVRRLRRNPGFSVPVFACLALAIGANAAVFAVVRGLLDPQ